MVELIAGLVLVAMLATFIYSFMFTSIQGYLFSTENTAAVGELKPMLDYVTTRMSDMVQIECLSTNSKITFTDTGERTVSVAFVSGDTLRIDTWDTLTGLTNVALGMTSADSHVKTVFLRFDYELADGKQVTYNMDFSPRGYLPTSDISGCP